MGGFLTTFFARSLPGRNRARPLGSVTALALFIACSVHGEVFELSPSVAGDDCVEEFEQIANRLKPGDRLVLKGGRYVQTCRRAIRVQGTGEQPIIIEAAPGERPVLTRPEHNRNTQNNLELIDTRHLILRGIEFSGGSIGVRLLGDAQGLELAQVTIRNTGNAGFTANTGNSSELYLHHNHVFDTGLSDGQTEGEGFYLGCHDASCAVSDSRIVHNRIERLGSSRGGGNDGIEIKPGSGGNTVAHNVIVGNAAADDFPCIVAYGGARTNLIENNWLDRCNVGIHVVSDAVVRGNVISNTRTSGITLRRHRTTGNPRDLHVVNNTIEHSRGTGLSLWLWGAESISVVNNAVFAGKGVAITGIRLRNARFQSNRVEGRLHGVPLAEQGVALFTAQSDSPYRRLRVDQAPGSVIWHESLVDSGSLHPQVQDSRDIAGTFRPSGEGVDVGAIEHNPR